MELYGQKSASIPQKLWVIGSEIALLFLTYHILFGVTGTYIFEKAGWEAPSGDLARKWILFSFSLIIFLRITFMLLFLLKRKIPAEEAFSITFAFALYFIGFALLACDTSLPLDGWDVLGILIFLAGSFLNTGAELQRHLWKQKPEHKGKLYTRGLFHYSMHINYFGDLLWVTGCAILTRNPWAILIPLFLFCFFTFYNIPQLDAYLADRYKDQFDAYRQHTRKFIPFIF